MDVYHISVDEIDIIISALENYKDLCSLTFRVFDFSNPERIKQKSKISNILYKLYNCQENDLKISII